MMFLWTIIPYLTLILHHVHEVNHAENGETVKPRAYYVSVSGNDQYDGTMKSPFKSVQRINNLTLQPGDSVLFEAGRRFAGSLRLNASGKGDPIHSILISSWGIGNAEIYSGNNAGIILQDANFIVIEKIKLIGSGRKKGNIHNGFSISGSRNIIADHLDISGYQKSGLSIDTSHDIAVRNIFSHENGFAGISVGGSSQEKKINRNIYIGYCRVENNPGDPTNLNNHSGNGIVVGGCTDVLIEFCTATRNGWDMPRIGNGPVGIWAYEADSVVIQHCLSYHNKTSVGGEDGGGFDFDGGVTNSIIQYCMSYENQGAGYCMFQYDQASPWHDNVYRYNISINDGHVSAAKSGIYIWNNTRDSNQFYNCRVYNNSIYTSPGAVIHCAEKESLRKDFSFYNNIFIGDPHILSDGKSHDVCLSNKWVNPKKIIPSDQSLLPAAVKKPVSAGQIKKYYGFKVPAGSKLRYDGIDLEKQFNIETGAENFNGHPAPKKGIGASF